MAQHDYVIANGTGAATRADLNNGLAAIVSNNSGATEPATMYAYQWWADTTTGLLKIRNAANSAWVTVGTLASANLGLAALASPTFTGTVTAPTFTASTAVNIPLGSAGSPTLFFTGDTNNGLFSPGADIVALTTDGSERFRIAASGQIGLGGANYGTSGQALTSNGSGSAPTWQTLSVTGDKISEGNTEAEVVDTGSDGHFKVTTEGSERLRIDSSGRVGIGTTTPAGALDVRGTILGLATDNATTRTLYLGPSDFASSGKYLAISWSHANQAAEYYTQGAFPHVFLTNNAERARIDSSGRLLVGTASIAGTASNSLAIAKGSNHSLGTGRGQLSVVTSNAQGADIGGSIMLGGQSSEADWVYATISGRSENNTYAGYFAIGTSNAPSGVHSEALRVNSSQELLVGYTTDNGAYKLQVNSQIFATSATVATSDGRYKENVATLGDCVDLVKALRPVSFTWKPQEDITRTDEDGNEVLVREGHNFPDGTQVGFIAQEVQQALEDKPWLTSVIKQNSRPAVTDADGNELAPEEEFLGIAEGNLSAVLTSALQEAIAKIETLEARLIAAGIE